MKRKVPLSLLCLSLFAGANLFAGGKGKHEEPVKLGPGTTLIDTGQGIDFHDDDLVTILRLLAQQAKISLIIDNSISGKLSVRVENETPLEAIEMIAKLKNLSLSEKDGVYYLQPDKSAKASPAPDQNDKALGDLAEFFSPALFKVYDSLLDYTAKPETAEKRAKVVRAFYDALIKQGFTRDEAFQIILKNPELNLPSGK